nr:hypothetical protein [Tanacetum cinerariifolium]
MLSRISFHVLYGRPFKTLCLLNYALMKRHDYDITSSVRRGALQLWYQSQMVNTRTDADLSTAIQNALQTLLPQIRAEIREEFRTSSEPSDAGGNPPTISYMEKIFDVMGCEDAFKTRLAMYKFEGNALAWWKAYKQAKGGDAWLITVTWTNTKTSTEFMQLFLRLAGFLGATADVAQVANAARNYEILHERYDDDAERPDKRRVVIGISRPPNRVVTGTTAIVTTIMDQTGEVVVTTIAATTTTLATTTGILVMGVTRETGVSSPTDMPILTPRECRRAAGTCFKCGQAGHLQKDCKKNTIPSTSGQADKKPGASGRVFAITED